MRNRIWCAALAAAALFMAAVQPAQASDNYPVRDGTGASQTFCSKLVGGLQYPCHLIYGMFGSTPTAVTSDGSNLNVHVQASALPGGAATSDNQTTANTTLGLILSQDTSLNTVLGAQADAAWSGTGSGTSIAIQKYIAAKIEATRALLAGTLTINLPSGASTATNQTAVQANAGSDASKAVAVQGVTGGKALTVDGSGVTQPVSAASLPLPTGAGTAANQATAIASLASIDGKVPALGQAAMAGSVPVTLASDQNAVTSTSTGVTITTALTFQSVLASNSSRKGCLVQNKSTDVEELFIGANGSATVAASLDLQPGQTFSCAASGGKVVTDNLSMTSKTLNGATAVVVSQ